MKKNAALVSAIKIFLVSLIISAGVSVICNLFLTDMGIIPAVIVVVALILIGIIFDIIGVAFASCDEKPFIAMSAKRIKKAQRALVLLKMADTVSNVCNDVVGDICGIVSGAAGSAIVIKIVSLSPDASKLVWTIVISSFIAAFTVGGKRLGKSYAMRNNIKIVEIVGGLLSVFGGNTKKGRNK